MCWVFVNQNKALAAKQDAENHDLLQQMSKRQAARWRRANQPDPLDVRSMLGCIHAKKSQGIKPWQVPNRRSCHGKQRLQHTSRQQKMSDI
jgi:hypothetical protein